MAVCGIFIYIYIYIYINTLCSDTRGDTEDFTDSTGYGSHLGDFAMDKLGYTRLKKKRSSMMKKTTVDL